MVTVSPQIDGAEALFEFFDEHGKMAYSHTKIVNNSIHQ
jgi:hypothetical protein